jgi:hypothetical protein
MIRMNDNQNFVRRFKTILGSKSFFYAIVALFCLQALWIALSNRYPMAFDEDYHFGLIRIYAHHLIPFWHAQPTNSDVYGAVFRDPSYLYHYLMSFPYRLISLFTNSQTAQVLCLRFINIGLFATGLFIFRRLLYKVSRSATITNFCLLLYVLIPVVPLLAGQINYDNLFIPLVGLSLLWFLDFATELWRYQRINTYRLILLLTLCLLVSLVKYAFLPIFLAIAVLIVVLIVRRLKHWHKFKTTLLFGLSLIGKRTLILLAVLLAVSGLLFTERYGLNIINYHTPLPDCAQVLNEQRCGAYGPWNRDHALEIQKTAHASNIFYYFGHEWLYGMWFRLFFAVDGPITTFETRGPLPVPGITAIVLAAASLPVLFLSTSYIRKKYQGLVLLLVPGIFYVLVLFVDGYRAYVRTAQPVAINGRYLLPVLPLVLLLVALSWSKLLGTLSSLKVALAAATVLCLIWGGGVLTFVLRSNDYWYWNSSAVRSLNYNVRSKIGPITPGYSSPVEFLR